SQRLRLSHRFLSRPKESVNKARLPERAGILGIRPAESKRLCHSAEQRPVHGRSVQIHDAGESAHDRISFAQSSRIAWRTSPMTLNDLGYDSFFTGIVLTIRAASSA